MSGALDEDTVQTVQSGRRAVGDLLNAAQSHLQKVFIVFVIGLLGTIMALQYGLWDRLRQDLMYSKMDLTLQEATRVVAVTPFDVILLQAKIGIVIGALMSLPLLIYFGRDALRRRGYWPGEHVPVWQLVVIVLASLVLFSGGIAYGYELFFPLMFDFLAGNAVQAGFKPHYSIVKWFEFVFLLSVSFGLAAQLPLAMSALAYTGIVPYETFRDKWKHAVLAIFTFGALFSPPDPFTQIMWAAPLCGLYAFSLGLSKLVVTLRRSSQEVDAGAVARTYWNKIAAGALVAGGVVYSLLGTEAFQLVRTAAGLLPFDAFADLSRPTLFGLSPQATAAALGLLVGAAAALVVLYYYMLGELGSALDPTAVGDPTAIDIENLDAAGVRAAPPEVFEEMDEHEVLHYADTAISEGNDDKAAAILNRHDEVTGDDEADGDEASGGETAASGAADQSDDTDPVTSTTAGVVDAFTEDETTEDDIGGYYHDIAFILDSLTSKAIWLVGVFMAVLAGTFFWLYRGGIGEIRDIFVSRLPATMVENVDFVTLHPVEHLVFIIKVSTILGFLATLPILLYFAWPAMKERGLVVGDRNVLLAWGGTLFLTLGGGILLGFLYVAPTVISWLAYDVLQANMVISYRVNNFGWLVLFLTAGIGILVEIPITMVLFHRGGIVSYASMRRRWRAAVLGIFAAGALFSPKGIFTMFLLATPIAAMYLVGLGCLWVYTLGGRRSPKGFREPAD